MENRTLLTTLVGGDVFEFLDANEQLVRVAVTGDTIIELIGADNGGLTLDDLPGRFVEGDRAGQTVGGGVGGPGGEGAALVSMDLFSIYVAEGNADSNIAIYVVDEDGKPAPYTGSIGGLRVFPAAGGEAITVDAPEDTGGVYIGARTEGEDEETQNIPVTAGELDGPLGVAPAGEVIAGITTAAGQSLGKVFIGGTVTGRVDIDGSLDTFYAGWLLTGVTGGQPDGAPAGEPENFRVGGDLRNLVVARPVGGDEGGTYVTGFDLSVGGAVGQVFTGGSFQGAFDIANGDGLNVLPDTQEELESRPRFNNDPAEQRFTEFLLGTSPFFNDTLETAQRLGAPSTAYGGTIRIDGSLNASEAASDRIDFYSVALMAGQTVTVTLRGEFIEEFGNDINLGIFDADGRLIETDYTDVDFGTLDGREITFTADRPGEYRFAVGLPGDANFNASQDDGERLSIGAGERNYTLEIRGVGDLALGGLRAAGDIRDIGVDDPAFLVRRGDLGSIVAGGTLTSIAFITVAVDSGDLRAVQAGSIGVEQAGILTRDLTVAVPAGGVGLIRSTSGVLGLNSIDMGLVGPTDTALNNANLDRAVGGDIQLIDAATNFVGAVITRGSIGVVRAGEMSGRAQNVFIANADRQGGDGVIDLVDVTGDFGGQSGGPIFITGPGGDVRFIRVGGAVRSDRFFNLGVDEPIIAGPLGQTLNLRDDSGADLVFAPTNGGALEILAYGIRGSGGSVVIRAQSSGGMTVNTSGPTSVGELRANGEGRAVVTDPLTGRLALEPATRTVGNTTITVPDLNVVINGSGPVDVFEVRGGNFTTIANNTGGDLISVDADSIGTLSSKGDLGLARNTTGAALNPNNVIRDVYPFVDQRTALRTGDVVTITADGAIGNVIADDIGSITANADRRDNPQRFEGIAAPVFAFGDIGRVQIGEGIAATGRGDAARGGIFAEGAIGTVENQGAGSDIRGNVVGELGVQSINLTGGGSIIDANIMSSELIDSREGVSLFSSTGDVGNITLAGDGGIIGARITGNNIGDTAVRQGFGILNSVFQVTATGNMGDTTAAGFGVRDTFFIGGTNQGDITATANGGNLDVRSFTPSVRVSDRAIANSLNNLASVLEGQPLEAGQIRNVDARGSGGLGTVSGFRVVDSRFNFAQSVEGIISRTDTGGVGVVTGKVTNYISPGDVTDLQLVVAGQIGRVVINGDLLGDSLISATGPNGSIGSILVLGDATGDIHAEGGVGTIDIRGDLTGDITIEGTNIRGAALKTLKLAGSLKQGSLTVNGDVGTIDAAGSLGSVGDTLVINGDLKTLKVGTSKDAALDGASLNLDLTVLGNLGTVDVAGQVVGNVNVRGNLSKFNVVADGATRGKAIATGNVNVGGDIKNIAVTNGDLGGDVTAGRTIGKLTLTGGDIAESSQIQSAFGGVGTVTVKGGDMLGDVSAANGTIKKVTLEQDLGSTGSIAAEEVGTIKIGRGIASGANITVSELLKSLAVGADAAAGATIEAGSVQKLTVANDLLADLRLGASKRGATITAGGDLGGDSVVDSDLKLKVGGDVLDSARLFVGGDLLSAAVGGVVAGDVLVAGEAVKVTAGSLEGAVLTTGLNLRTLDVGGAIENSLVQAGISPGDDGRFTGESDADEVNGSADIGRISAASVSGSVIAAGGDIVTVDVDNDVTDSTVSSGLNLGSTAIAQVLSDDSPLDSDAERSAARRGADRSLFQGDIGRSSIGGTLVRSDLTAGIDAGADGVFGTADDSAVLIGANGSISGGRSAIGNVAARLDADSNILAAGGIGSQKLEGSVGPNVNGNVALPLESLTGGNALETFIGNADSGRVLTHQTAAGTVTISVTGNGTVALYDSGNDNVLDTLVLRGTDGRTRVSVTGGADVGRILAENAAEVGDLSLDGDLVGDGTSAPDLFIGGSVGSLSFGDLATGFNGFIGGDLGSVDLDNLGAGRLRVGGEIGRASILGGDATDGSLAAFRIGDLNVASGFAGRVEAGTGGIGGATFGGPFSGTLFSVGRIDRVDASGEFSGDVESATGIGQFGSNGAFTGDASVLTGELGTFRQSGGVFAGSLEAESASSIGIDGAMTETGTVRVTNDAGKVAFGGDVAGGFRSGTLNTLTVAGLLGPTGRIATLGDAGSVNLAGGTEAGGVLSVGGAANAINVGGVHRGTVAAALGAQSVRLISADAGTVALGVDTRSLSVTNDAIDSVFVFGVDVGDDGRLNTADDVITGGSVGAFSVTGNFIDSVVSAGVLPGSQLVGEFRPGESPNTVFGSAADPVTGGTLASRIGSLRVGGRVESTDVITGRESFAVAADAVGPVSVAAFGSALRVQTIDTPFVITPGQTQA